MALLDEWDAEIKAGYLTPSFRKLYADLSLTSNDSPEKSTGLFRADPISPFT